MRRQAVITAIAGYLPERVIDNEMLASSLEGWGPEKILDKTGIRTRRWAAEDEFASDMAVKAAERLFATGRCGPGDIDLLVLCTQSPDYLLPTTACLLQHRLGLPTNCLAFDFNLGCSGYVYGLALVKALLENGLGRRALLVTAETYSKFLRLDDRNAALFGDAATASLVDLTEGPEEGIINIGPFVFGTDGSGALNLIAPGSASRPVAPGEEPGTRFFMDGPRIFEFALQRVPEAVKALLAQARLSLGDVDLVVMHQANRFMLEHLRRKIGIPPEKFTIALEHVGNTVSSSIPLAMETERALGRLKPGMRLMLVGFGVGYSWAACLVIWR